MLTFADCARICKTARDPYGAGKPIRNNTRIMKRNDETYALRFHSTDIVTFHRDGDVETYMTYLDSPTTRDRFWNEGGTNIYNQTLPTFNGRLPSPSKTYCVRRRGGGYGWQQGKHLIADRGDRILWRGGVEPDMDTVSGKTFEIIIKPTELTRRLKRARAVLSRIEGLQRLGYRYGPDSSQENLRDWLHRVIDAPDAEIDPTTAGIRGATFVDNVMDPYAILDAGTRWMLARDIDAIDTVHLKVFEK